MGFVVDFNPVMFTIAGFSVYWYGFAYSFGFAFMVFWLWRKRNDLGWTAAQVIEISCVFIVLVLAGGRVFDIVVYEWEWYRVHPSQMPQIWVGGMATHGLLAGSALAALAASLWTRTPLLRILDILVVAAAFIFGVGRIGNFIEGGVVGTVTSVPWGVKLPDLAGYRHPVSLYDGAKNLLLVPILVWSLRRWPAGQGVATAIFLAGYGGLRFLVDQFRDYEQTLGGIGPGQWFNIGMGVFGVLMFFACTRRPPPPAPVPAKGGTHAPLLAGLLLAALLVLPLSIPTSWTTTYLAEIRSQPAAPATTTP